MKVGGSQKLDLPEPPDAFHERRTGPYARVWRGVQGQGLSSTEKIEFGMIILDNKWTVIHIGPTNNTNTNFWPICHMLLSHLGPTTC